MEKEDPQGQALPKSTCSEVKDVTQKVQLFLKGTFRNFCNAINLLVNQIKPKMQYLGKK